MENTTPLFIKLTHLKTGKPTYIKANNITSVRQNDEGVTLILQGDSGQYVKESVEYVIDVLTMYGFGFID
ncbi:hypothetical protein ACR6EC_07390 [Bacillus subtilis]|uniref:Uncharacterized protein n=1 Tax=Bacillus subtilis TaxID=1423 RepID=A0AC61YXE0_BACIU|nr:hypothetical protein [Bacillus subtilis]MEC2266433.1 hypothetical protein [Bacillus subtilis]MEC4032002.1 hypothetical protein [Bacillus subtilis]MUG00827.1 hypothetical protein [Bacillus tequilensis]